MPPTFPIFLGLIAYIALLGLSIVISGPMLLTKQWRVKGKIIILTAIIPFPTLLLIGLTLTIIFALPGIGIIYLLFYLGWNPMVGFLMLFLMLFVAGLSFYHWYLGYIMIKNYMMKNPLNQQIENDKIYSLFYKRVINLVKKNSTKKNKKH